MQPNEWQEQEAVVERETRRYLRQTTLSQKVSQFGVFGVDLPNNIFPSGWHRRRKTRRVRLCMTAWTVSPPFPALFDRPPHRVNGFPPPPPPAAISVDDFLTSLEQLMLAGEADLKSQIEVPTLDPSKEPHFLGFSWLTLSRRNAWPTLLSEVRRPTRLLVVWRVKFSFGGGLIVSLDT